MTHGLSTLLRRLVVTLAAGCALGLAAPASAQVKADVPAGITPAWSKGIQPISRESYWSAVECGKQKTARPACVFYDADLCKNAEFTLALYTPYKKVAYEVWQAVSQKKEPPTPSWGEAQRTSVVLGVRPLHASSNPLTGLSIKRGGKTIAPVSKALDGGGGTFTFDFAAVAPTGPITIEFAGKTTSVTCSVSQSVLARMR